MDLIDKIITDDMYRTSVITIIVLLIISFALFCVFVCIINKTKIYSKYRLVKSVALASPIIASVVAVLCIFFITITNYIEINQNKNTDLNSVIGEINIITTILSIAIAVWIGLNIYNVVEKRQIDQLTIRTKNIKRSTDKSKKASKEINSSLEVIKEQVEMDTQQLEYTQLERVRSSINLLINILINTQQDVMTSYFIREFYSLLDSKSDLLEISELDISRLICIETYFKNVYQSYKDSDRNSVKFFAFKGIETIDDIEDKTEGNLSKFSLYTDYLMFRRAELNFYLGMVQYGNESLSSFEKAITNYILFTKRIQMFLPDPDNYDIDMNNIDSLESIDLHLPIEIKTNKEKAYLCNTLGQAYNRMIRQGLKDCISKLNEKQKNLLIDYYKKAFVYFEAAVTYGNENNNNRENYVRNLGTFYELLRFLIIDYDPYDRNSIRKNREMLIKIIDKANSYYSMALSMDGRKSKAHITDASAILKKVYILSEIEDAKMINGRPVSRTELLFDRMNKHEFDFGCRNEEYQKMVKNAIIKYELAISLTPMVLDSYYGLAKAYLWLALNDEDLKNSIMYLKTGEKYIIQGKMINNENIPLQLFFIDYHELMVSLNDMYNKP